ncbi:MAG TPA: M48 family metallopeptidase [Burkholderiaceae bacterium]|nr:M48 family metallopeptidase [Burkholderiaceae bacterium]
MEPARFARSLGGARRALAATFAAAALVGAVPDASAQQAPSAEQRKREALSQDEGIAPPKRSRAASLASSEALEKQATQQYAQLLKAAAAQRALAPADYPPLIRLQGIAQKLIPYTHRFSDRADEWRWEVNLIGSKQVNAFVMPGGKIAFFTGIIDRLRLTDDEIAMIMGHEMAHALIEHGRERAGQQRLAQIATVGATVFSAILGYGDLGGQVVGGASQLTLLKFNRGDETEADLVGMDIAARAGFDPRAAVTLWQKMSQLSQGQGGSPEFLSTHPAHGTRIETIRAALPKVLPLYARTKGVAPQALPPYGSNFGQPVR